MKNLILISIFFIAFLSGTAQSASNWYKVFTGKFGNMDATLHLCIHEDNYSGYIWFKQLQWPMPVYGLQKIVNTDSIMLSAGSGPISVNLSGVFHGDEYSGYGTLQKDNSAAKRASFDLKSNTGAPFTSFDYYFTEEHSTLSPKLKNESTCDFSSGTIWPKENNALSVSLKNEISSLLKIKTPVSNPQAVMNTGKDQFIAAWHKDNSRLTPKDASDMGMSLSVSQDENIMVMYEDERSVTLADFASAYTGGAHNMYSTSLICFDKKTGKKLQLKDVLTADGIKVLPAYLDRVARLQYDITNQKPLDENNFFVKQIKPSENFYLTSTGIGFLYPPYELKSFADGEINLLVPLSALGKYLQPAFKN